MQYFKISFSVTVSGSYKPSGQDQINTRSSILKLKHPSKSMCFGQNALSYLTPTIWNNLPTCLKLSNSLNSFKHGAKKHFWRNWKTKNKIFCLLKWRVSHQYLFQLVVWYSEMFLLTCTSEGARTIFDFPVVLELVQLLVGLWVSFTFNFRFMFKNSDFLRGFFKGPQWK